MTTHQDTLTLFEQQKKRHALLQQRRTRAEALRDAEREALARTRAEAKALFGTDDLELLRQKLAAGQAENVRKTSELTSELDTLEKELTLIETHSAAIA